MTSQQPALGSDNQLRIVFDHSVVSRPLEGRVTLGDIARMWSSFARGRHGDPVAISVTLGHPGEKAAGNGLVSRH